MCSNCSIRTQLVDLHCYGLLCLKVPPLPTSMVSLELPSQ